MASNVFCVIEKPLKNSYPLTQLTRSLRKTVRRRRIGRQVECTRRRRRRKKRRIGVMWEAVVTGLLAQNAIVGRVLQRPLPRRRQSLLGRRRTFMGWQQFSPPGMKPCEVTWS